MTAAASALGPRDRDRYRQSLYRAMSHRDERPVLALALGVAVSLHLGVLFFVVLPEYRSPIVAEHRTQPIEITKIVPPPPPVEPPPRRPRSEHIRMLPVPDPDPERPEPIRDEPRFEEPRFYPPEFDVIIPEPDEPPQSGPLDPETPGLIRPVLILGTKVQPVYPETARRGRVEGDVVLQAVIGEDGRVDQIEVLRCNRPNLGFEQAALDAVRHWRYEPAMLNGRPVPVYLTVEIAFTLY